MKMPSNKMLLNTLSDLRNRLAVTRQIADEHASSMQAKAKRNYDSANKVTVNKQFTKIDRVLVLIPGDSRILYARWLGPATVRKRMGDQS